jgi:hypothetical protein
MPNIVNDYAWTVNSARTRADAPRINCQTWKVTDNQIFASIKGYQTLASSGGVEYYDLLHTGAERLDRWTFPFFTDEVRGFTNQWGDTYVGSTNGTQSYGSEYLGNAKDMLDRGANTVSQIGAFFKPGALFEPPKFYTYGISDNNVVVEFSLINTFDDSDARQNYKLTQDLINQNRFERGSSTVSTPPVLWSVNIPGYRYIRWAACSVNISLLGRRQMSTGENKFIMPEGYRISLNFASLYTEPNNFASKYI